MSELLIFFKKNISQDFLAITGLFLLWKFILIIFAVVAINFIPLGSADKFLGGGPENYNLSPEVFAWANFDGEHYLSIAIFGYKKLEQAFFPAYPALISILSRPFYHDLFSALLSSTLIGLLISNLSFLMALVLLWELVRMDFSRKIAFWTLLVLLFFPTSFYFGSVYSGASFLFLTVASFYSARQKRWFWAMVFGTLASATRVFGFLLFPALLIETWQQKIPLAKSFWIVFIPAGLLFYMWYQWTTVGDPLAFYHLQQLVGEQHQSGIILLPQVFFRYIKMFISVSLTNSIYQTIFLEFVVGVVFFLLPIYGFFKKIRLSCVFFALAGFLLPTIQGSFSSTPRYVLVLFPSFIVLAILVANFPKWAKVGYILLALSWLGVETMLFLRGYWVA